ncbi:MAG: hypothetical protein N2Z67_00695 [Acetobacteraceae bacterium]|nr:hypothetical protein [Acetobacteraceae bacterium]
MRPIPRARGTARRTGEITERLARASGRRGQDVPKPESTPQRRFHSARSPCLPGPVRGWLGTG